MEHGVVPGRRLGAPPRQAGLLPAPSSAPAQPSVLTPRPAAVRGGRRLQGGGGWGDDRAGSGQVAAPYRPSVRGDADLSCFCASFTSQAPPRRPAPCFAHAPPLTGAGCAGGATRGRGRGKGGRRRGAALAARLLLRALRRPLPPLPLLPAPPLVRVALAARLTGARPARSPRPRAAHAGVSQRAGGGPRGRGCAQRPSHSPPSRR